MSHHRISSHIFCRITLLEKITLELKVQSNGKKSWNIILTIPELRTHFYPDIIKMNYFQWSFSLVLNFSDLQANIIFFMQYFFCPFLACYPLCTSHICFIAKSTNHIHRRGLNFKNPSNITILFPIISPIFGISTPSLSTLLLPNYRSKGIQVSASDPFSKEKMREFYYYLSFYQFTQFNSCQPRKVDSREWLNSLNLVTRKANALKFWKLNLSNILNQILSLIPTYL